MVFQVLERKRSDAAVVSALPPIGEGDQTEDPGPAERPAPSALLLRGITWGRQRHLRRRLAQNTGENAHITPCFPLILKFILQGVVPIRSQ